jgi:hypothetical protein
MKTIVYKDIPSLDQWKRDSSVAFAVRKEEPGLIRIDDLLAEYPSKSATRDAQGPFWIDLFLTIEYWFKMRQIRPGHVEEGRLPAMRGLLDIVLEELSPFFSIREDKGGTMGTTGELRDHRSAWLVSKCIKRMTGASMTNHGFGADHNMNCTQFDATTVWDYRLWFRDGRAYQVPWWAGNPGDKKLVLANSKHGYLAGVTRGIGDQPSIKNWSPFIMTISRFIYMAKHDFDPARKKDNYFHSSYNDGNRVGMAGTIGIEDGIIRGVRLDSGHYQPGLHNLTSFLWALKMYQVDLSKVELFDYSGGWIHDRLKITADDFLKSGLSWDYFCRKASDETDRIKTTEGARRLRKWQKPEDLRKRGIKEPGLNSRK